MSENKKNREEQARAIKNCCWLTLRDPAVLLLLSSESCAVLSKQTELGMRLRWPPFASSLYSPPTQTQRREKDGKTKGEQKPRESEEIGEKRKETGWRQRRKERNGGGGE